MASTGFGVYDKVGDLKNFDDTLVAKVIRDHPKVSFVSAQLILLEAYDIEFGIYDHVAQARLEKNGAAIERKRPFALFEAHYAEDASKSNGFETILKKFSDLKVGQTFQISLLELLQMPRANVAKIFEVAEQVAKKNDEVNSNLTRVLENGAK